MLQLIREKVTGWIAATIITLLIIPFEFWGINYYYDQGGNVTAASVNGAEITLQQFQQAYQNIRQQWQSNVGGSVPAEQEAALKQRAIEGLVERELLNQVNTDAGLRVSNGQISEAIRSLSYFQGTTGFDRDIYERSLSAAGQTPSRFENEMRQDMVAAQLQNGLVATAFVTRAEIGAIARMLQQKRDISYAVISSDAAKDTIEIAEEEILRHYEAEALQFMEPEQLRIAYIELALQDIAAEVSVSEAELLSYHEANKSRYDLDEQRKYQEIFIKIPAEITDEAKADLHVRAESLLERIRGGATFDELAKEQDAAQPWFEKINMDFMTRGIVEPEVDEVLFTLEEGGTSDLVETGTGIQIIQVQEIKGGIYNTFADVRDQVEQDFRNGQAETRYYELADQLVTLAFEHPDTLQVASEELKLPVRESSFFSRQQQDSELLRDPKIITTSFSEEVLLGGNNSEAVELSDNRTVVLRVIDHKPESKKPLDAVREQIVTRLKYEKSRDLTRTKGEEILQNLRENVSREDITTRYGIIWNDKTDLSRDDTNTDFSILRTAFSMGSPVADKTLMGGASLSSGDYAVIIVSAVREPEIADVEQAQIDAIEAQLDRLSATNSWLQYLNALHDTADIEIYQDNL